MTTTTLDRSQLEFLSLLAHLFLQNGKFAKAAVLLRTVQAFAPRDVRNRLALAYADLADGDAAGALRELDALPQPETDSGAPTPATAEEGARLTYSACWLRTKALHALGREDEARAAWQAFLAAGQGGEETLASGLSLTRRSDTIGPVSAPSLSPTRS